MAVKNVTGMGSVHIPSPTTPPSSSELPKKNGVPWSIPELLRLKRDGKELTSIQLETIVQSITDGSMEDCHLGAFLMSVFMKGMTVKETAALTNSMMNSGTVLRWPNSWKVVDKHSTGGVGDKVSLPLAPALAALGLKVPMISGRGLGHTGGTLDKLESIPGYSVTLSVSEMKQCLENVGCCIVGQTRTLVPADGRMYAVRDITATVESIPLIVSSIISKKAAEGLKHLVLDVKCGSGTNLCTHREAETLADALVALGEALNICTSAFITRMDSPVGRCVGNALEVKEALECLRGRGPKDLRLLVSHLGGELAYKSGVVQTMDEGVKLIETTLDNGSALEKFSQMLVYQGVPEKIAERLCGPTPDLSCLPTAKKITRLLTHRSGRITGTDALTVGRAIISLGGGRTKSSDVINYGVGLVLLKTPGDEVKAGEPWIEIHHDEPIGETLMQNLEGALSINEGEEPWCPQDLIVKKICKDYF